MSGTGQNGLILPVGGFEAALARPRWWEAANLRALAGASAALGYARGPRKEAPEWGFLAADVTTPPFRAARRSVAVLRMSAAQAAVVAFDAAVPGEGARQTLSAAGATEPRGNRFHAGAALHTVLLPGGGEPLLEARRGAVVAASPRDRPEALFLNVTEFGAAQPIEPIRTLNLAGVRLGDRVTLFHAGLHMTPGPVFFDTEGGERLRCLVTGLAPGSWDVWWNGWLEMPGLWVAPQEGVLYFEGPSGGYYLRRYAR